MILNPKNSADRYSRAMSVYELFMKKGESLSYVTIPAEISKRWSSPYHTDKRRVRSILRFEKGSKSLYRRD